MDRAQWEDEKNVATCLFIMFTCRVMVIKMSKIAHFLYFLLMTEKNHSLDKIVKDTLKALHNFKNKQKRVWSNVFWYVKVCLFWKCIQYTIQWGKMQMLKKVPS